MTHSTAVQYLVTTCPDHGTKEVSDLASFAVYVEAAREDDRGWHWHADQTVTRLPHAARWDAENGASPWRCCWHMVIDPYGILDH
jgi:hypothetical protein